MLRAGGGVAARGAQGDAAAREPRVPLGAHGRDARGVRAGGGGAAVRGAADPDRVERDGRSERRRRSWRGRSTGCGRRGEAVRFADGVRTLEAEGVTTLPGARPAGRAGAMGARVRAEGDAVADAAAGAKRSGDGGRGARRAARARPRRGLERVLRAVAPERVVLPTYAFQRERYWLDAPAGHGISGGASAAERRRRWRMARAPADGAIVAGQPGWLSDHRVFDEMWCRRRAAGAGASGRAAGGLERVVELTLEAPLGLPAGGRSGAGVGGRQGRGRRWSYAGRRGTRHATGCSPRRLRRRRSGCGRGRRWARGGGARRAL